MSVSNEVRRTLDFHSKNAMVISEKLREALRLSKSDWASYLEIRPTEYESLLSKKNSFSSLALYRICDRLNLNISVFKTGNIDYAAVAAHSKGDFGYLPEKYKVAAFSRNSSALIQLGYLEQNYGWNARQNVLKRFQLNEQVFTQPNTNINLLFYQDLLLYLKKQYQFGRDQFQNMGAHSLAFNKATPLGAEFSTARKPSEVFERMFGDLQPVYEKNCDYRIQSITSTECVVDCYSKNDIAQALGVRHLGSTDVCAWKLGVFTSAPGYLNLPYGTATEVQCVHRGDSRCRFVIEFRQAHKMTRLSYSQHFH